MRRSRVVTMAVALALALTGCGSGDDSGADDLDAPTATTTTTLVPTTAPGPTVPATDLTLRVTDLRLVMSEETDRGVRILLPAGVPTATVTLSGIPSPNRVISVCQTRELTGVMSSAVCRPPIDGEPTTLTLGSEARGVELIHVAVPRTGSTGSAFTLNEVTIRYAAPSREVNVRLPELDLGDLGGHPTFALAPASADGAYRAAFAWRVIPTFGGTPSQGQLEVLRGETVVEQAQGSPEVRFEGTVPAPRTDLAVRAQNIGTSLLVSPTLELLLP